MSFRSQPFFSKSAATSVTAIFSIPVLVAASLLLPQAASANAACVVTRETFVDNSTTYIAETIATVGTCDWIVPTGVTSVRALLVGGGGGGGGGASASVGRAGGGGGGAGRIGHTSDRQVSPGATLTVTVGAGGAGGTGGVENGAAATTGGSGGTTSIQISSLLSVSGGGPGTQGTNSGGVGGDTPGGFFGGFFSGLQGGSGGSNGANGSATTAATAISTWPGYSANDLTFGAGGGGGNVTEYGTTTDRPGSGGGGGRGSLNTSGLYTYGYNASAGRPGIVIIRYAITPTTAPQSVTAAQTGSDISLAWSAPTSNGGAAIEGYLIEISTDSGNSWTTQVANTQSSTTSALISGLAYGQSYIFRVSAINAAGTSTASSSSAGLNLTAPPAPPYTGPIFTNLGLMALPDSQVTQKVLSGERLDSVRTLEIDGKNLKIISQSTSELLVEIPILTAGVKDLHVTSTNGNLVHISAFNVLKKDTAVASINIGSFNGKLVVYAKNLDGKRISWKVGGNWGKATAVGNTLNRFDRPTPRRGVTVSVQIYVDGVLQLTKSVVTR